MNANARAAAPSNRNQGLQLQLNQSARKVNETLPPMISAIKSFSNAPSDLMAHTKLIHAAKPCVQSGFALVECSNIANPSIADTVVQSSLAKAAKTTDDNLHNLDKALKLVDDLNSTYQMDNAMMSIKSIQADLIVQDSTGFNSMYATSELAQEDLFGVAASIQATIAMLAETAAKGNEKETGTLATDAVLALQSLSMAVQGFAATEEDESFRDQLLDATSSVGDTLIDLMAAAKEMAAGGTYNEQMSMLAMNASNALTGVVGCMPGQRELEAAIADVSDIVENVGAITGFKSAADKNSDIGASRVALQNSATKMSMTANSLLASSKGTTEDLKNGATTLVDAFRDIVDATLNYGTNVDEATGTNLSSVIQEVGTSTTILLQASKGLASDKENINSRDQLLEASKEISDAMDGLLEICSAVGIGHKECNEAYQKISLASSNLDCVLETGSNTDTYGLAMKVSVAAVVSLNTVARAGDMERLASKIVDVCPIFKRIGYQQCNCDYRDRIKSGFSSRDFRSIYNPCIRLHNR
jgi:talin